ncbi:helix-turn-helix transcriptional regulator [Bordetella sp. 2513F-2]
MSPSPVSRPVHSSEAVASHALVRGQRLLDLSGCSTSQYRLSVPQAEQPVLQGVFDTVRLRSGLVVHSVDARDLQTLTVQSTLKAGIRLALVVGGRADVSFGPRRMLLGPECRPGGEARGMMISLRHAETFCRRSRQGGSERTVSILMPPQWLEQAIPDAAETAAVRRFADTHLAVHTWLLAAPALRLAEQILHPPALVPALRELYLEARALDLIVQALASLSDAPLESDGRPRPREYQRMREVRELLDSGQADELTLEQIACRAGMSVNTLQRHFRAAWGTTVFEYLREARLARARVALERDGVSVAQAAWIGGYTSPANFATAFRRRYGLAPGRVRARA